MLVLADRQSPRQAERAASGAGDETGTGTGADPQNKKSRLWMHLPTFRAWSITWPN
jgi:hypothetical protein